MTDLFQQNDTIKYFQTRTDEERQRQSDFLNKIVTPEFLEREKQKGQITAFETLSKAKKWGYAIPYVGTGAEIGNDLTILKLQNKIKEGRQLSVEETETYKDFVLDMASQVVRGQTIPSAGWDCILQSVPYMAEFGIGLASSGSGVGFASLGQTGGKIAIKKAVKDLTVKGIKDATKQQINSHILKNSAKTLATDSTLGIAKFNLKYLPQQGVKRWGEVELDQNLMVTPEGQILLNESEENPATSVLKAIGLMQIETLSETSGFAFNTVGKALNKYIAPKLLKYLPEKFVKNFEKLNREVTGLSTVKALQKYGWNGVLEEYGEERVSDFLQTTFDLDGEKGYSFEQFLTAMFPPKEQALAELMAFSIMGLGIKKGVDFTNYKKISSNILQQSKNDDGTYDVEKIKRLVKKNNPAISDSGLEKIVSAVTKGISKTDDYSVDDFLCDCGVFRLYARKSNTDERLTEILQKNGMPDEEVENVLNNASLDDKAELIRRYENNNSYKPDYSALKNDLINAGHSEEQAELEVQSLDRIDTILMDKYNAEGEAENLIKKRNLKIQNIQNQIQKNKEQNYINSSDLKQKEIYHFKPEELQTNAKVFQYKENSDEEGKTDRMNGVEEWSANDSGIVIVWQAKDGQKYIADGHQRLGLAKRLNDDKIRLDGILYKETDGYTPEDVRMIAAKKNIAEGSGTAIDTAKILRKIGEYPASLPRKGTMYEYGIALARLGNEAFEKVINGYVTPAQGAVIANIIRNDHIKQSLAIDVVSQAGIDTLPETELMARQVLSTPAETVEQTSLFGTQEILQSSAVEKIKIIDSAIKILNKSKNLMAHLGNNQKQIEKNGNVLNQKNNEELKKSAEQAIEIVKKLAFCKGIISDKANELAQKKKNDEISHNDAVNQFVDFVMQDDILKIVFNDKNPSENTDNGQMAFFQSANTAGAETSAEISDAQKEWQEKGTDSKYFKKWFGDSKVVDENGKPLVVYHGSLWNFEQFEKSDEFDFSFSPKFAYEYAAQKSFEQALDLSPVLYSVYLKAENPFDFRDEKSVNELLKKIGDKEINFWGNKYSHEQFKDLIMGLSYENTVKNQEVFDKAEVGMAYSRYNEDVEEKMSSVADAKIVYKNKDYFVALDEIDEPRRSPFSSEPAGRVDRDDVYKQVEKLAKDIDFADEYIKKITLNTNLVKTTYEVGKGYVDEYTPYELTVRLRKVDNPKIAKKSAGYDNWSFFETTKIGDTYFLDFLKENGYDSYYKQEKEQLNISVFNPEQIKSVDNRGTFDEGNANIYYQPAYHGSPAKFDKFDHDYIGSGEGAQVHGYGTYVAESKHIADERYRKRLTNDDFNNEKYYYDNQLIDDRNKKAILATIVENGKDKVISVREKSLEKYKYSDEEYQQKKEELAWVKTLDENKIEKKTDRGQLYEVEIPEDEEMLDEDLPFSEQPKKVQDAIKQICEDYVDNNKLVDLNVIAYTNNTSEKYKNNLAYKEGRNIYGIISEAFGGDKQASLLLNEYGIKGIKYNGQTDGQCYVIFNPENIDITRTFYQKGIKNSETINIDKEDYINAEKDIPLPNINHQVLKNLCKKDKPLILKSNIIKKNKKNHPEILIEEYNDILSKGLQSTDLVFKTDNKNEYYNFIHFDNSTNEQILVELSENKDNYEIVNFYKFSDKSLERKIKKANNEGGQFLITDSNAKGAAVLSALEVSPNNIITINSQNLNPEQKTFQQDTKEPRAKIEFSKNETIISLMKGHDASSVMHELGHLYLHDIQQLAKTNKRAKNDLQEIYDTLGYNPADISEENLRNLHENFAKSFEAYLLNGESPTSRMKTIFEKFKEFLKDVYNSLSDIDVEFSTEVKKMFDKLFTTDEEYENEVLPLYEHNEELAEQINKQETLSYKIKDTLKSVSEAWKSFYDTIIIPIDTRLGMVSPELKKLLRKHTFNLTYQTKKDCDRIAPFLFKIKEIKKSNQTVEFKGKQLNAYNLLSFALNNRDSYTVNKVVKLLEIEKEFSEVRNLLEEIYEETISVGLEVGYLESYFPRMVQANKTEEFIDLFEKMSKEEEIDLKNQLLELDEAEYSDVMRTIKNNDPFGFWNSSDKAKLINTSIRGFGKNNIMLSRIGQLKFERMIDKLTPEQQRFYEPIEKALTNYVIGARKNIEERKFFGAENKEVSKLRAVIKRKRETLRQVKKRTPRQAKWKELNRLKYELGPIEIKIESISGELEKNLKRQSDVKDISFVNSEEAEKLEGYIKHQKELLTDLNERSERLKSQIKWVEENNDFKVKNAIVKRLNSEIADTTKQIQEILGDIDHVEDSVGRLIVDLAEKGVIHVKDEKVVRDLLVSRFNSLKLEKVAITARDVSTIVTLNDITNAITQISDLTFSAFKFGLWNTFQGMRKVEGLTREDLGLNHIAEEFRGASGVSAWLNAQLKIIGLDLIDGFAKNTEINASIYSARQKVKKNDNNFIEKLNFLFGDELSQKVQKDLIENKITDEIIFIAFNDLADIQPITTDQMTRGYQSAFKPLYVLKTYSIKALDILRNDCFSKITVGMQKLKTDKAEAIALLSEGVGNLIKLQLFLWLFGLPQDLLKDLVGNREFDIPEHVIDNLLIFGVFNRFLVNKVAKNPANIYLENIKLPAIQAVGDLWTGINQVRKGKKEVKDLYVWSRVPIIGKLYYNWLGGKKEKRVKI